MLKIDQKKRLKSSILALAIAMLPMAADAAGLGKLTVISALGQPLRAEIDLTASREEYSSLSARLASADAFKNAGIEYSPALSGIRFTLDKRPNGQPFLVATSDRPLNEPFIDMLVEVNWASGRLVREYTFLLDPPDVFKKPAETAVLAPEVKKEAEPGTIAPAMPDAAAPVGKPGDEGTPAKKLAAKPAEAGGATRQVKSGDTLGKIANEVKPEGVNLDQMLVALFRSNKDVFDGGNMNRLRAGKILSIPDKEAVIAVERGEARKVVVAQAIDFNAYRKRLAAVAVAAPAKAEAPKQAAAGKITPKVEEKIAVPPAGKDKLEVSRTETGKGGKPGAKGQGGALSEEDLVARDKALKEANSRIAELEKNLNDLKKLAEMKSAAGAKLQEQAQVAKPGAAPAPAVPAKPAEAAKPAPAVPAKPAEAPKPAEAAKPVEPPKPADAGKPPVKKPVTPPPPPPPSFVEDNPEIVFGGGGIIALLLGYLGYNAWRRKRTAAEASPASIVGGELSVNSVFGLTGGQSVDTGASLPTDSSQGSTLGMAGDEGVDPVAEADVYMAYGRDSQAEEILLEALKTEPTRRAIHLKLLEIYAARKSAKQFEAVARELHSLTDGIGPDWDKAVMLGRSIDPANPLYGGGEAPAAGGHDMAAATVISTASEIQTGMATMAIPGALAQMAAAAEAEAAAPMMPVAAPTPAVAEDVPESLDFDLDLGAAPAAAVAAVAEPVSDEVMSLDFDLDLGSPAVAEAEAVAPAAQAESAGLDFDLGTPVVETAPAGKEAPVAGGNEVAALDFDFNLGETAESAPAEVHAVPAEPELPAVDFSAISLELGEAVAAPAVEALAPAEAVIEDNAEVATKLELAQAYEEMGDKEGARELLNEVLNEGSPAQQDAARNKLAQLG